MSDVRDDVDAPFDSSQVVWRRLLSWEAAAIVVLLMLLGHLFLGSCAGWRRRHTCVICRLERIDYHWQLRRPTTEVIETACSRWYPAHVEAVHEHDWSPSATMAFFNYYGQATGAGDNFECRGRAIWRITPEQQIGMYQHFQNPLDAKRVFVSLTDKSLFKERDDYKIVKSLRDWADSNYAGQWQSPIVARPAGQKKQPK